MVQMRLTGLVNISIENTLVKILNFEKTSLYQHIGNEHEPE